ncbi:hypothetical protein [Microbacterium marinilacus]|uniref:Uncharacterized protein n=1 Tax=Microbacterium marinilacus TaxID=415209 RepID=A0ABP7BCU3_9MICO|nr:hypothetical protein [Microbacterium marinilacus]MBY0689318.1 hypothetical protein [Microbacterium marinilacus]
MSTHDNLEPDTQGTDPLDAAVGEDGQGDLAPEDLPQRGTDDLDAAVLDEDGAAVAPDRAAGAAPGPGDVTPGDNVDTMPRPADDFRPEATGLETDEFAGSGAAGPGAASAGTPSGVPPRAAAPSDGTPASAGDGATVPPGREGADSGAVDSVSVEGSSSPDVERSSQNDIAGVGPASGEDAGDTTITGAPPVDPAERADVDEDDRSRPTPGNAAGDAGAAPQATDDAPTQHGSDDPSIAGVPDAVGPGGAGLQTGTRQDLNEVSVAQQVQGIVVQTQADVGTDRLAESEVSSVLEQRLTEAGLNADVEQIEELAARVLSGDAPTDVGEGEPGAGRGL